MKGTSALALLASMAGANAFVAPRVVSRYLASAVAEAKCEVSTLRMSAETEIAVSNVVNAEGLVRHPPGDVKLDQAVLNRCEPLLFLFVHVRSIFSLWG